MRRVALLLLALAPGVAQAHTAAPQPGWRGPEPWMLAPMLAAAAAYAVGFVRLRRRSEHGRAELTQRMWIFVLGLATLAGATLSPLHQLGGRSFTAHMLEHELIMLAAAPLLVWARPLPVLLWSLPADGRKAMGAASRAGSGLWRLASDPWVATALQAAALWIWHLPSLFDRALRSEAWHAAQHLSFFATALLFWSAMLGPRRSPWVSAACLFVTSMASGALGAFMALSASPWYGPYASLGLAAFGLSPAEDQQLAGALMWAPGGLFHAAMAVILLAPALRSRPRHA